MLTKNRACTLLKIDLGQIVKNWRKLAAIIGGQAECSAVVKANAYGLGAAPIASALWEAGARTFFVATLVEGIELRKTMPKATIAVLNGLLPGCESDYNRYTLFPVLNHLEEISRWHKLASKENKTLNCYLHFDTGMNRLGIDKKEAALLIRSNLLEGLSIKAYLSHFACADIGSHPMIEAQSRQFDLLRSQLPPAPASLCNSSGIFCGEKYHLQLVRPGGALYGINPTPSSSNPMESVISWQGKILQIKEIEEGESVGYGATFTAQKTGRIAIVAAGYADGLIRPLGNKSFVAIGGYHAPIIGRVSMDLISVDITAVPEQLAYQGGYVDLLNGSLTIDHIAKACGTIGYEVFTALGRRCYRYYTN